MRECGAPCSYPVLYLDGGKIRLGGLFEDEFSGNRFRPKTFELPRQDGESICIPDLLAVDMLFLSDEGYFDRYSQKYVLEPRELEDLYIFAIRAKDAFRCDPDYYDRFEWVPSRPFVDGYRVVNAELFELAVFHNEELAHVLDDVFRGFKIGRNVQVIYVKPNPAFQGSYLSLPGDSRRMSDEDLKGDPPYAYWRFAGGESSMLGVGWDSDPRFIPSERQCEVYGVGPPLPSSTPVLAGSGKVVTLHYHFEPTAMFQMLHTYASEHGSVSLCDNLFADDTTRNYSVDLPADGYDHIAFVEFIFNHCPSLAGEAVYWSDLDDYYCGTRCLDTELRLLSASPKTREANRELLRRLYQRCGEPYYEERLPETVSEGVVSGSEHIEALREYMGSTPPPMSTWKRRDRIRDLELDEGASTRLDSYFRERAEEFERRKAEAKAAFGSTTWTGERTLFEMVRSYYPDAIYQHRAEWLGRQSLDVFIPSIGTAVEYQGRQHYKSVACFGGEASLDNVQRRDSSKRTACECEGVRVIEWPYWVPINALTLFDLLG